MWRFRVLIPSGCRAAGSRVDENGWMAAGDRGDFPPLPGRRWSGGRAAHARHRRWPRHLATVVGVACIVVGAGIGVQIYRYHVHSDRVGSMLVQRERQALATAGRSRSCSPAEATTVPAGGVPGAAVSLPADGLAATSPSGVSVAGEPTVFALLEAPSIGLVAPVVDGTGEPELSVALGHVTGSSWPGPAGTAVLEGHDVTWFSRLGNLQAGDPLVVATPCKTMSYQVQTSQVVSAGTPILQTTGSRLVLVTCYPLDSLSLTTQRLVVTADLTGIVSRVASTGEVAAPLAPVVPAPAALEAQGLDLLHNPAPMGTLSLTGTPTVAWQQSAEPLADEGSVITLYFAALRSAEQDQPAWWAVVAPTVPFEAASALVGATVSHNDSTFSPVLQVTGTAFTGATLTVEPVLSGGTEPGLHRITMTATVVGYQLLVSGWTVTKQ